MSSALAIPGVTAVLRHELYLLYNGQPSLPEVKVSAKAPDVVQNEIGNGDTDRLQVNLFLHQVTPNAGWHNAGLPSLGPDGRTVLSTPPVALDLHYLLTAYAFEDSHAEALLGYAVAFLHDNPVLLRGQITSALAALPPNAFCDAMRSSGLANQVEMIKITPATLGREEMAWLWTALKADYRPTFPFQVSVVLIESQNTASSGLPVLERHIRVRPDLSSPVPTLAVANPPKGQPAACLGDVVVVEGTNLSDVKSVLLTSARQQIQQTITITPPLTRGSFQFQVAPSDLPPGFYVLTATAVSPGGRTHITNGVPLAIAPQIVPSSVPGMLNAGMSVAVAIQCTSPLRAGQDVSLLIGNQQASADHFTAPDSPSFIFESLQPTAGPVPLRLRVDGVDSPCIDFTQSPPKYSAPTTTVNP